MTLISILMGLFLICMGRRLFWLFVGLMGFVCAFSIAQQMGLHSNEWVVWGIALFCGAVGALLAIFVQHLVVGVAGFASGAYIAVNIALHFTNSIQQWFWLIGLGGGIIGLIAFMLLFDWALILISAIVGAGLVILPLDAGPWPTGAGVVLLTIIGVFIQRKGVSKS
jgi:hypothetical protein